MTTELTVTIINSTTPSDNFSAVVAVEETTTFEDLAKVIAELCEVPKGHICITCNNRLFNADVTLVRNSLITRELTAYLECSDSNTDCSCNLAKREISAFI